MKIRRTTSVLLALTLWTAGTAFASSASDHFPVSPAAWDETCISQEEAVAAAKDAMEQQGTPYVEMDGKVKAGFVQLENGENAWAVILDSALKMDAVATVSPRATSCITSPRRRRPWKSTRSCWRTGVRHKAAGNPGLSKIMRTF